jgi:hypothetical protein
MYGSISLSMRGKVELAMTLNTFHLICTFHDVFYIIEQIQQVYVDVACII